MTRRLERRTSSTRTARPSDARVQRPTNRRVAQRSTPAIHQDHELVVTTIRKHLDARRRLERVEGVEADFVQHVDVAAQQFGPRGSHRIVSLEVDFTDRGPPSDVLRICDESRRRIRRRNLEGAGAHGRSARLCNGAVEGFEKEVGASFERERQMVLVICRDVLDVGEGRAQDPWQTTLEDRPDDIRGQGSAIVERSGAQLKRDREAVWRRCPAVG